MDVNELDDLNYLKKRLLNVFKNKYHYFTFTNEIEMNELCEVIDFLDITWASGDNIFHIDNKYLLEKVIADRRAGVTYVNDLTRDGIAMKQKYEIKDEDREINYDTLKKIINQLKNE